MSWQQDLTPLDHDSSGRPLYFSDADMGDSSLEEGMTTNLTLEQCKEQYKGRTEFLASTHHQDGFCKATFDQVICWPPTPLNETVVVKCFSELFHVKYDDTQNATRQCLPNATWTKPDFSRCKEIVSMSDDVEIHKAIYFAGYTLSLLTLLVAIGIFTHFKELRCLRNTIHMNLMWSYMLTYCMWILTLILVKFGYNLSILCVFDVMLLYYFHNTTFFWMFVEGLYLYILVVRTLTRENFKLRVYVCIGWGLPLIFLIIWGVVKSFVPVGSESGSSFFLQCRWFSYHDIDWIFQVPTLVVLLLNFIFLISIMWVLITKLRSANTLETQQYHKAAKALLVLMPLLGIQYVIMVYAPKYKKSSIDVFELARAILISTQGFTVALFYCFLNTEVQNAVRHHFNNWKTRRSLGPSRLRAGSRSRDWSPRSRTESIRRTTEWTLVNTEDVEPNTQNEKGYTVNQRICTTKENPAPPTSPPQQ
ncbi:unnamed protein product [Phaedon cochleariae]|uniref:Diuretic hormone receptor n=1 Tax=Phaedon cochleariae TaxID=80249 RepID=A0A9N9S8D5_PHACE|nr:unnamed protein product [Phaedon cochleariae]